MITSKLLSCSLTLLLFVGNLVSIHSFTVTSTSQGRRATITTTTRADATDNNILRIRSSPVRTLALPFRHSKSQSQHNPIKFFPSTTITTSSSTALSAIEVATLDNLQDHEAEGSRLSASVAGWLNVEWMPQDIHVQIGERVKSSYIRAREEGENEIMNIMTLVVDDLTLHWKLYDQDAFVNAWDIGNYVSDYLHNRVGVESCGCNAVIFQPEEHDVL